MKKLSKIKLNQLSKEELERRQLNALMGGRSCDFYCTCGCLSSSAADGNVSSPNTKNWESNKSY